MKLTRSVSAGERVTTPQPKDHRRLEHSPSLTLRVGVSTAPLRVSRRSAFGRPASAGHSVF